MSARGERWLVPPVRLWAVKEKRPRCQIMDSATRVARVSLSDENLRRSGVASRAFLHDISLISGKRA